VLDFYIRCWRNGIINGRLIIAGIPCFNESWHIGTVILKVKHHVDRILVVDDGSTDDTGEVAIAAGAIVFRHPTNQGVGSSTRTLIEKALRMDTEIMVLIDGDGQHDADEIPTLLKPIMRGEADIVIGSRFLHNGARPPLYRQLGQRVLTGTTNILSGCRITDSQSGFRALSWKALSRMDLQECGFCITSEMQFQARKHNLRVTEVPITSIYNGKAKRNPFAHGFYVLARIGLLGLRR